MSYGFNVLNSAGQVIADGTNQGYGLIASGTLTTSTSGGATASFSGGMAKPLVFIKADSSAGWFVAESVWNSGFTLSCYNSSNVRVATSVQYKVYSLFGGLPAAGAWGVQHWDASGTLTFDSNYELPLIKAVGAITAPYPTNTTPTVIQGTALPSGITVANYVCITPFAVEVGYAYYSGSVSTHLRPRFNMTAGGSFQIGALVVSGGGASADLWWARTYQLLFI